MLVGTTVILIVFSGIFFAVTGTGSSAETDLSDEQISKLADCLQNNNATMYGLKTCPHCQHQKELFGDQFKKIDYVECSENNQKCKDEGISGVPVWKINGKVLKGTQKLTKLADTAGCSINASTN